MTTRLDAVRSINVTFPADVLALLDSVVSSQERERFIVQATEEALRRKKLQKVLAELRKNPAWSDEDHPDLMTAKDVDRHIRRLRETWMPRSWDEIAEKETTYGQSSAG